MYDDEEDDGIDWRTPEQVMVHLRICKAAAENRRLRHQPLRLPYALKLWADAVEAEVAAKNLQFDKAAKLRRTVVVRDSDQAFIDDLLDGHYWYDRVYKYRPHYEKLMVDAKGDKWVVDNDGRKVRLYRHYYWYRVAETKYGNWAIQVRNYVKYGYDNEKTAREAACLRLKYMIENEKKGILIERMNDWHSRFKMERGEAVGLKVMHEESLEELLKQQIVRKRLKAQFGRIPKF